MQSVGLMLLAAGASTRLGQPKQLLPYQGRTLLRRAAETAAASGCAPLVLVTGALHEELLPEVAGLPFSVVRNVQWAEGMGGSIRVGLAELESLIISRSLVRAQERAPEADLEAVIVMLCDQPLLSVEVLQKLTVQFQATGQPVVASAYGDTRGVPALFSQAVFPALRALHGPAGARELLRHYGELPAVYFPEGLVDVDTATQYAALVKKDRR